VLPGQKRSSHSCRRNAEGRFKDGRKELATKILISDPLAKEGMDILRRNKSFRVDEAFDLTETDLAGRIKGYEAVIVRSGTRITDKVINAADNLKIIGRAGVGLDNVDIAAASKKGILVMNAPTGNSISTAEHAFGLMMALSRNIPNANQSVKSGRWERKKFMGIELYGKVLGIIGLGRIGSEFARRALSFGMRIIACDPFFSREKAKNMNVESVDLDTLLKRSDFITIHTPLTEETRHLLDDSAFRKMKKGVRLINAARGGIVDEKALTKYIRSGKVAGAALDVFETSSKPPVDSPVVGCDKVITTPHLGSSTEEAQVNVAVDIARCVSDALQGKGYRNAANIPAVDMEFLEKTRPYIKLAEKLGTIQAQLSGDPIESVKVEYAGEISDMDTDMITRALVKGIFDPVLEENVNYVNALIVAKERGVRVIEKKTSQITDFANIIRVDIKAGGRQRMIMGTLFSNKDPRVVMIDKFYIEAAPQGYMLVISNKDVPGIVGKVGTILGKAGINIAGINLGRDKKTGRAISLLNLDSEVPKKIMSRLKSIGDINDVKQVKAGI